MMAFFMGPLNFYRFVYISTMTSVLYSISGTSVSSLNLTIKQQNSEYILSWEAGNNTQAPTYYIVKYTILKSGPCFFTMKKGEQESSSNNNHDLQNIKECSNITDLFCVLTRELIDLCKTYVIVVETFPKYATNYSILTFIPYFNSCLGPPEFNVSACSNCVNVTAKIPSSLLNVYKQFDYKIKVKTVDFEEQDIEYSSKTKRERFGTVIEGLLQNTNYCVSVDVNSSVNKMCVPSPWKCIVTSSKDKSDYVIPIVCAIVVLLALGVMVKLLCMAGFINLKLKERPAVMEATKLNYSLFDSHPEEVHSIQVIQERGKTFGEESYDGDSSNEKDAIYTIHRPLGPISKSHSEADVEDTASIGCSSTASDCQIAEVVDTEAEDPQYDVKKEDSATDQMLFPSSQMNSISIPKPEETGGLNINLNTVKLKISNTKWDALVTLISFPEDRLQEPCDPDVSEPKHFANVVDTQSSGIHDLSPTWQNDSGSDESESSEPEMVGEYMRR